MKDERTPDLYLNDITESIEQIKKYTGNLSDKDNFFESEITQDAVIRRIEIIGEAIRNFDDGFRSRFPNIPWKQIVAMRNMLIHEYFGVEKNRVWKVVEIEIPKLEKMMLEVKKYLADNL